MIDLKITTFQKGHASVIPRQSPLTLAWSAMTISLDPKEYDDPTRFYPERYLNADLNKPLAGHWSFGMGRRGLPPETLSW
jgi:cytochrome P450